MQTRLIHGRLNTIWRNTAYEEGLSSEAKELKGKVAQCKLLREKRLCWSEIKKIVGISRSKYYRYKKLASEVGIKGFVKRSKKAKKLRESKRPQTTEDLIKRIRSENPTYGKEKIAVIIKRDHGIVISESSVGRVLKKLLEIGKIQRSLSARPLKRERVFRRHAKRWQYGKNAPKQPGEIVQIDHMSVSKNDIYFKDFQAWDTTSKYVDAEVFTNATSHSAKKFLYQLVENAPFKITSVQVDGGSEFMAEFEQACADIGIELFVIPPKKPKYNGGIERSNRTFREEFYARKDLLADPVGAMRTELKQVVHKYNSYRPHQSIDFLTHFEYINSLYGLAA